MSALRAVIVALSILAFAIIYSDIVQEEEQQLWANQFDDEDHQDRGKYPE